MKSKLSEIISQILNIPNDQWAFDSDVYVKDDDIVKFPIYAYKSHLNGIQIHVMQMGIHQYGFLIDGLFVPNSKSGKILIERFMNAHFEACKLLADAEKIQHNKEKEEKENL